MIIAPQCCVTVITYTCLFVRWQGAFLCCDSVEKYALVKCAKKIFNSFLSGTA